MTIASPKMTLEQKKKFLRQSVMVWIRPSAGASDEEIECLFALYTFCKQHDLRILAAESGHLEVIMGERVIAGGIMI